MSFKKIIILLIVGSISGQLLAKSPTKELLEKANLRCTIEKIKKSTLDLKKGEFVEFTGEIDEQESAVIFFMVANTTNRLMNMVPVEDVQIKNGVTTYSGSVGSILVRNKFSGSFSYDDTKKTAKISINNRTWLPGVGQDKSVVEFEANNCIHLED